MLPTESRKSTPAQLIKMRCLLLLYPALLLLPPVHCSCLLDEWGLPAPAQDPSKVFGVPAIVPLTDVYEPGSPPYYPGLHLSEAVLYTVQYINRHVLNGTEFCLNTSIIDNYMLADNTVSLSMKHVGRLNENTQGNDSQTCALKTDEAPVVGFLGAAISDNTIALANLCNILQIPQISYASTSLDLDDSEAYPYFLRTVPSDQLQAKAMVKIISNSTNWKYVGIIASEGNYGGAGLSAFLTQASDPDIERQFCIAFQYKLENPKTVVKNVVQHINETELTVIVMFSNIEGTKNFFIALNETRHTMDKELWDKVYNVTYIGSDSWSTDNDIFQKYHGTVFSRFIGVGVFTTNITGFPEHLASLNERHYNSIYDRLERNYFLDYWHHYETPEQREDSFRVLDAHTSTTADATFAFGRALLKYLELHDITSSRETNATALLEILTNNTFPNFLTGNNVSFGKQDEQVGRYYIMEYHNGSFHRNGTFQHLKYNNSKYDNLKYDNPYSDTPSICSAQCPGGQYMKSTSACCHECMACPLHSYSNGSTSECTECNKTQTHNANLTGCVAVTPAFLTFTSLFSAILYILIAGGLVAVAGITAIFWVKFNTPVVQGHGVFIYATLLTTCVLLLASTLLFLGEPSDRTCNLQLAAPILGVSSLFLCVICLTKTVILRLQALQVTKFYVIQLSILLLGLAIQGILVSLVLYIRPMHYDKTEITRGLVHGGCLLLPSDAPNLSMAMYSSTLAISLTSLILSFLGRNINENYNEGKFLNFQTIAMHIVIIAFVPTALLLSGPTLSAAWAVAIVILCYIVLIVLFTPKLYIIIYRPYKNKFVPEDLIADMPLTNGEIVEESIDEI